MNSTFSSSTLREVVDINLNPSSSGRDRGNAFQVLQKFRKVAHEYVPMLRQLCQIDENDSVRHFAIQMFEDIIRLRYNDLQRSDRQQLRIMCFEMIKFSMKNIVEEAPYIKDAYSRIIVELVKREWPQLWPDFLSDLNNLCVQGQQVHVELVMLILLRLSEDVVIFGKVPPSRRRDIQNELHCKLQEVIIPFLCNKLVQSLEYTNPQGIGNEVQAHAIVAKSALATILGYLEWADPDYSCTNDYSLIKILVKLLDHPELKLPATECLLVMTQCLSDKKYKVFLNAMFFPDCMTLLYEVASVAAGGKVLTDGQYKYLKRITQLLIGIGQLLLLAWDKTENDFVLPETFPQYISILMKLSSIPSTMITLYIMEFLPRLVRTASVKANNQAVAECILEFSTLCLVKLHKVGGPSDLVNPGVQYSRLDFDSQYDWRSCHNQIKSSITQLVSLCCTLRRAELLKDDARLLHDLLHETTSLLSQESDPVTSESNLYIRWDALSAHFGYVFHDLHEYPELLQLPGLQSLMLQLLNNPIQDPMIRSFLLTCISTLSPICLCPQNQPIAQQIISHIFSVILDMKGKPYTDSSCVELKRHACYLLPKISLILTDALLPLFEEIHNSVEACRSCLQGRELRGLLDGLLILSLKMRDLKNQENYIRLIIGNVIETWNRPDLQNAIQSGAAMAAYLGLQSPAVQNREQYYSGDSFRLLDALQSIFIVAKRSSPPTDLQVVDTGGFRDAESGLVLSGCSRIIYPLLDSILMSLKAVLSLYSPEVSSTFHPDHSNLFKLMFAERANLLGQPLHEEDVADRTSRHHSERYQKNLIENIENTCQILYYLIKNQPYVFFAQPNIIQKLAVIFAEGADHVPFSPLKYILKSLVRGSVTHCPAEKQTELMLALCNTLLPRLALRIDTTWQKIQGNFDLQRSECDSSASNLERRFSYLTCTDEERRENMEEDEVIEEELLCITSREYLEIVSTMVMPPIIHDKATKDKIESVPLISTPAQSLPLENLKFLLSSGLQSSVWPDTHSVVKALEIAKCISKYILNQLDDQFISYTVCQYLTAIHIHGKHEDTNSRLIISICELYESLICSHRVSCIRDVFLSIDGIKADLLRKFEAMIKPPNGSTAKPAALKTKKSCLRELLHPIIGKNLSEEFKEKIKIQCLPPITKYKPPKCTDLVSDSAQTEEVGLCDLFNPNTM